jgi:hypothetical protein
MQYPLINVSPTAASAFRRRKDLTYSVQHTIFRHLVGWVNSESVGCTVAMEDNFGPETGGSRLTSAVMVRKPIDAGGSNVSN